MSVNEEPNSGSAVPVAEVAPVRRTPRYGRFIFIGVVLGAILGTILTWWAGRDKADAISGDGFLSIFDGQGSAVFLVAVAGAFFGALLAALIAIALDRTRRSEHNSSDDNKNVTA